MSQRRNIEFERSVAARAMQACLEGALDLMPVGEPADGVDARVEATEAETGHGMVDWEGACVLSWLPIPSMSARRVSKDCMPSVEAECGQPGGILFMIIRAHLPHYLLTKGEER